MRNGSYTSSTVSSGSLDADRQRLEPDRSAAEALAQRAEHGPVDLVEAELVDAEQRPARRAAAAPSTTPSARTSAKSRTRRSRRLAMRGVPRARRAISAAPVRRRRRRRGCRPPRPTMASRSSTVVVVEPGDEAEAVAQRPGDQPGAGGGADEREAGQVEADRAGGRALARARCRAGSPPSPGRGPPRPARARRWISSMKRTSPSSRLVRMAARSPARSRAGPDVTCEARRPSRWRRCRPCVVLPRPGGPAKQEVVGGLAPAPGRLQDDRRGAP